MYNYLYIFCFLILIMFLLRLFIPIVIWLLPIILVFIVIRSLFARKKQTHQEEYYQYDDTSNTKQSYTQSDGDVIDVDYTVVDEETNTQ